MRLTVLSVAYPLAPVSRDSAGGAEQVLAALDRALVRNGHRSIVIAQEGSQVAGHLVAAGPIADVYDAAAQVGAQARHRSLIAAALRRWHVDVVHMHGIDFDAYLPPPGPPVLATLHLPLAWYRPTALRPQRLGTWLHGVSQAQHLGCPADVRLLPPIENGVDVPALSHCYAKRDFTLILGRICPEKGIHLAIEAAAQADFPLLIAGQVYPYPAHQAYFETQIRPHLGSRCRYLGPVGWHGKRHLLASARCVLIPSLAAETSSLVAREAAACGTPAIAFARGALTDTIEHGTTGFLVQTVEEMAAAIRSARDIDPQACRRTAQQRFSEQAMTTAYLTRYQQFATGQIARTDDAA